MVLSRPAYKRGKVLWRGFINEEICEWNVHKSGKSSLHLRAKVGVVPASILTKPCWYDDQICSTTLSFDAYSYLATVQRKRAPPRQSQGYKKRYDQRTQQR
jgi:hypothetical protein